MANSLDRLAEALKQEYTLERELGAGGMATVFLAEDRKHQRQVAVKVLRPELAAVLGAERFVQEITTTANLQHPHILPVYDSGEAEGFLYYVMPYVEGESLRDRLVREGELPLTEAVRILRDVADALAAAHAKGVVHRDIKPENIMLSGRHALVADFGVAKAVSGATGRQALTTAGVALGTPTYMAPEQAAADPNTDHRADLYAFGVTAYEMVTGQPPFVGPTPQAVLAAHLTEAPVDVSQRRTTIPPPLAELIMRCLAKKPADRPQHAEDLLPILEALRTPSGGITPVETQPTPAVGKGRRRRWILATVGMAVAVVAVFGLRQLREAEGARVAVFPFDMRSTDSSDVWLAEGLSEQIGGYLTRRSTLRVLSATAIAAQRERTSDPFDAARALDARWMVTGTLRRIGTAIHARVEVAVARSGVQTWSSSFDRADGDLAGLEREVADSVLVVLVGPGASGASPPDASPEVDPEAYRLYLIGNTLLNRRTPATAVQAAASYQEAVRRDSGFAAAWAGLGMARIIYNGWKDWPDPDVPRDTLPALARQAAMTALKLDPRNAVAMSTLAYVAGWEDEDFAAARRDFETALAFDSSDATIWHHFGAFLGAERANDLAASERLLRRSLAIDPDQRNTWRHLAVTVAWQGRLPEGEAILDTLIGLYPSWAPAFDRRAYFRYLRDDGAGAIEDLRTWSRLTGTQDSFRLALYAIAAGDSQPAIAWLAQPDTSLASIAKMNVALGRRDAALEALERLEPRAETWVLLQDPIFKSLRSEPRFVRLREESRPGAR